LIRAEWIGSRVPSSFAGRVHSVYRQACNIEADDGALVALLPHALGNLPHGILCSVSEPVDFRALCAVGHRVARHAARLRIPQAGVTVDLSGAAVWRGGLSACRIDPDDARTLSILADVRVLLRKLSCAGGFAPLILRHDQPGSTLDLAMQRRLEQALPSLARAIDRFDAELAVQALAPLAGLGPGLTPSGDDFIVGWLGALWARCSLQLDCRAFLTRLAEPLGRFVARSHAISRQFLLDALAGEFSEALSDLACAIATHDRERALTRAENVLRFGHSSGADALAGFLFGLQPELMLVPLRVSRQGH
jgi:hypothetical protein